MSRSRLRVNLRAFFHELFRLRFHPLLQRLLLGEAGGMRAFQVGSVQFQGVVSGYSVAQFLQFRP